MQEEDTVLKTCDCFYCIGHSYADEAYYDSTTDVSCFPFGAKDLHVDAVLTFNSDPAALTAAYVSEKLGLPSSSYEAVRIMSEKDLLRNFLFKT